VLGSAEPEPVAVPIAAELDERQVAAGGGVAATTIAASQMPSTTYVGSMFTTGGTTSAIWKDVTITFATTALGTWDLGATPKSGSIGLGTLVGTVGKVKTKRGEPDATPAAEAA
jgi:hypothetical protein